MSTAGPLGESSLPSHRFLITQHSSLITSPNFPIASSKRSRKYPQMINPRYFLLVVAASALSSCATYNSMRQDPATRVQPMEETEEAATSDQLTHEIGTGKPVRVTPRQSANSNQSRHNRRNTGLFIRPGAIGIPTDDDLKETATSTQKPTRTPGLTVPN